MRDGARIQQSSLKNVSLFREIHLIPIRSFFTISFYWRPAIFAWIRLHWKARQNNILNRHHLYGFNYAKLNHFFIICKCFPVRFHLNMHPVFPLLHSLRANIKITDENHWINKQQKPNFISAQKNFQLSKYWVLLNWKYFPKYNTQNEQRFMAIDK